MSDFGERLRLAFKNAKNVEIAEKLGVTPTAVRNYLNGRVPDHDTLLKIAEITDCDLHWLLAGKSKQIVRFENEPANDPADVFDHLEREIDRTDDLELLKKRLELTVIDIDRRIKMREIEILGGAADRDLHELRGLHFDDGTDRYRVEETDEELSEKELFLLRELEKERRMMEKPLHPRARTFDDERAEKK